ncbi:hypothetical protein [Parasitella parasitica]|uniref:UDP-glycosyltransferases domain-containing protein n=1 Tax=Parasitella parasitica TaxID=35722 RepID=A0A0B7NXS8_9FUNG|nr:hypothetical protein [Parasitella parasitica]
MKISSTVLLISSALVSIGAAAAADPDTTFEMLDSFREPKNIAFSAMVGGSSHIVWVLSILEELASNRGHNTYFFTREDQTNFGKNYPSVETVSVGPSYQFAEHREKIMEERRKKPVIDSFVTLLDILGSEFEPDYLGLSEQFKSKKIDLAICDHFNSACVEASIASNIPFIITACAGLSPDAGAPYINNHIATMHIPTSAHMSLWQRLDGKFIKPVQFVYKLRHFIKKQRALYKSLGIKDPVNAPEMRWENSLKIFNTAFGFDLARPLGPLVEYVGPIVASKAPALTPELVEFFETHKKVAYVAFGQHAIAISEDVKLLMTGLLEAYEAQELDGIIWATRGLEKAFPDYLITQSNTTYNVRSFFDNNSKKDITFINWAPQIAILNHPSTNMFITHGGAGSLYESLNAGVRVVVFPFFGDQPASAQIAEDNGIGLKLHYTDSEEKAVEVIRKVARDECRFFQGNANRYKAIVQLNSQFGVLKAANLVEEVLFTHRDGELIHRRDVKRDMSFFKATNMDLYAIAFTMVTGSVLVLTHLMRKAISSYSLSRKLKTN